MVKQEYREIFIEEGARTEKILNTLYDDDYELIFIREGIDKYMGSTYNRTSKGTFLIFRKIKK